MRKMVWAISIIVVVLVLGVIGFVVLKGMDYYQSTYTGESYYIKIPAEVPVKEDILDDAENVIGKGYYYDVVALSEKGEKEKALRFSVIEEGEFKNGTAYPPGTFLKVKLSDVRILEQEVVEAGSVPAEIKQKLDE